MINKHSSFQLKLNFICQPQLYLLLFHSSHQNSILTDPLIKERIKPETDIYKGLSKLLSINITNDILKQTLSPHKFQIIMFGTIFPGFLPLNNIIYYKHHQYTNSDIVILLMKLLNDKYFYCMIYNSCQKIIKQYAEYTDNPLGKLCNIIINSNNKSKLISLIINNGVSFTSIENGKYKMLQRNSLFFNMKWIKEGKGYISYYYPHEIILYNKQLFNSFNLNLDLLLESIKTNYICVYIKFMNSNFVENNRFVRLRIPIGQMEEWNFIIKSRIAPAISINYLSILSLEYYIIPNCQQSNVEGAYKIKSTDLVCSKITKEYPTGMIMAKFRGVDCFAHLKQTHPTKTLNIKNLFN